MNALLTPDQTAELLGISLRDLNALCRNGEIRFVRVTPRKRRFRRVDIEEYIERKLTPRKLDTPAPRYTFIPRKLTEEDKLTAKEHKKRLREEMRSWRQKSET
jgi:excisionase family DNA binding protein